MLNIKKLFTNITIQEDDSYYRLYCYTCNKKCIYDLHRAYDKNFCSIYCRNSYLKISIV
jgi:lipid II:glycine glycyltransferase (peptidoglycan interpeptide bridge formation enzyme)